MSEQNKTVFVNTNFLTPDELDAKANELKALAADARKQDKFVRVWCDRGDKTGFPYGQVYVDKWSKQDRWTWIKGRKVEREQAKARKASTPNESVSESVGVEDGGQLELPLDVSI